MKNNFANYATPLPSMAWLDMLPAYRPPTIKHVMRAYSHIIDVVDAQENGHIIVRLTKPLSAAERGTLLLDIEEYLKETVDLGLTVWLDPTGDKSSLRNLRGIEIK